MNYLYGGDNYETGGDPWDSYTNAGQLAMGNSIPDGHTGDAQFDLHNSSPDFLEQHIDPFDNPISYYPVNTPQRAASRPNRHTTTRRKLAAAATAGALMIVAGAYVFEHHSTNDSPGISEVSPTPASSSTTYKALLDGHNGGAETSFDATAIMQPRITEALAGDTCATKVSPENVGAMYNQVFGDPSPTSESNGTILKQLADQTKQLEQAEQAQNFVPLPEEFAAMNKQVNDYEPGRHWDKPLAEYESVAAQYASQFGIELGRMQHEDTVTNFGPVPAHLETELADHRYLRATLVKLMADLSRLSPEYIQATGLKNIEVGVSTKEGGGNEAAFVSIQPESNTIYVDVSATNLRETTNSQSTSMTAPQNIFNHELGHQKDASQCLPQYASGNSTKEERYAVRNTASGGTVLWRLIGADAQSEASNKSSAGDGGSIKGAVPLTGDSQVLSSDSKIDVPSIYATSNRYELKAEVNSLKNLTPELLFKGVGNASVVAAQVSVELARDQSIAPGFARYEKQRLELARTLVAAQNIAGDTAITPDPIVDQVNSAIADAQTAIYGPDKSDYVPLMNGVG